MSIFHRADGRQMTYEEYGDPAGYPVFLFHGNPGSRLSWGLLPGSPFLPGLRLIAPDRPGYGGTDFKQDAIQTWPDDICELADHLGINKFSIFAPSGGGPFALMCAWKIPHRLDAVGIFGSVGPNVPEAVEGALGSLQLLWKLSNPMHWLVKLQMRLMAYLATRNPEKFALQVRDLELNEIDKEVFNRLELQRVFKEDFPEAYRQNGVGSAYDTSLPAKWPIPLAEITMPVQVWHAEGDNLVGNMSPYIAHQIPSSTLTRIVGVGHLWVIEHMADILAELVPPSRRKLAQASRKTLNTGELGKSK